MSNSLPGHFCIDVSIGATTQKQWLFLLYHNIFADLSAVEISRTQDFYHKKMSALWTKRGEEVVWYSSLCPPIDVYAAMDWLTNRMTFTISFYQLKSHRKGKLEKQFVQQYQETAILLIVSSILLILFALCATLSPLQYSRDKPVTMHEANRYLRVP